MEYFLFYLDENSAKVAKIERAISPNCNKNMQNKSDNDCFFPSAKAAVNNTNTDYMAEQGFNLPPITQGCESPDNNYMNLLSDAKRGNYQPVEPLHNSSWYNYNTIHTMNLNMCNRNVVCNHGLTSCPVCTHSYNPVMDSKI